MERADFPYAHIDLLIPATGGGWLTEINLRGGLKGARLDQKDYLDLVDRVHKKMVVKLTVQRS